MEKETIDLLFCPYCQSNIKLFNNRLICKKCKKIFPYENGVIALLKDSNKIVWSELSGIEKMDTVSKNFYKDKEFQKALSVLPNLPEKGKYRQSENYFWEVSIGKNDFIKAKKLIGTNRTILEVGADFCWASRNLAKDNSVIALDINKKHLTAAGYLAKDTESFTRVQGDMNELPIKNNTIDVIIASASVHHTTNLNDTLKEFARVLKHKGQLIMLREPVCGDYTNDKNFGLKEKKVGINEHAPKLKQWTLSLTQAGFTYNYEIAKLNFITANFKPKYLFRMLKRYFLSLPLLGPILAKNTITDFNFFAIKKH